MPVSSVNPGAVAVDNGSNDVVADGSRFEPLGWLNMMRACDGTFDVRLERFRADKKASGTAAATMTTTTTTAATVNGGDAATEEATSRKCEGQLSSLNAANSCSSYKSANRMTEMAQEDYHGPSWNNLPSVILQEIFSYLSHETRIRASQVSRWEDQSDRERERQREREREWEREGGERESLVFSFLRSLSVLIVCTVNWADIVRPIKVVCQSQERFLYTMEGTYQWEDPLSRLTLHIALLTCVVRSLIHDLCVCDSRLVSLRFLFMLLSSSEIVDI